MERSPYNRWRFVVITDLALVICLSVLHYAIHSDLHAIRGSMSSLSYEQQSNESLKVTLNSTRNWTKPIPIVTHPIPRNVTNPAKNASLLDPLPYCLWGSFYGQTGNRVYSLARYYNRAMTFNRTLALSPSWSDWYREHFDERPDIILDYYNRAPDDKNRQGGDPKERAKCFKVFRSEQAYRMNPNANIVPELSTVLIPKESIRRQVPAILQKLRQQKSTLITVHRRNFDGTCIRRASAGRECLPTCPQSHDRFMCGLNYTTILQRKTPFWTPPRQHHANNTAIWLFTDGQVDSLDDTFPNQFRRLEIPTTGDTLFLEMWIMAQSDEHWGHPESTFDKVIYHWRKYKKTIPQSCFPPNPKEFD